MYLRLPLVTASIAAAFLMVAACAPAVPAAQSQPTATPDAPLKLRVADGVTPPAALPQSILSLAAQQGYFQKEGLDVEVQSVNGTPAIITAMRAGEVDVGIINSSDVIKLEADKSLEMRVIGSPNGRNF